MSSAPSSEREPMSTRLRRAFTRGIDRATLSRQIEPGQIVIDLVNLEKARRIEHNGSYEGICW